jgi:Flp pilus assembly protein TadB
VSTLEASTHISTACCAFYLFQQTVACLLLALLLLLCHGTCAVVACHLAQVLWGAADYGAKVVFSSHLWQKNLSTVQQRREAAQELMGALDRCAAAAAAGLPVTSALHEHNTTMEACRHDCGCQAACHQCCCTQGT